MEPTEELDGILNPLTSHMGESWEFLFRSFKRSLMAINPFYEILYTLFCEIEYILNSGPFGNVSIEPQDKISMSPNDTLIGQYMEVVTQGIFSEQVTFLKKQCAYFNN